MSVTSDGGGGVDVGGAGGSEGVAATRVTQPSVTILRHVDVTAAAADDDDDAARHSGAPHITVPSRRSSYEFGTVISSAFTTPASGMSQRAALLSGRANPTPYAAPRPRDDGNTAPASSQSSLLAARYHDRRSVDRDDDTGARSSGGDGDGSVVGSVKPPPAVQVDRASDSDDSEPASPLPAGVRQERPIRVDEGGGRDLMQELLEADAAAGKQQELELQARHDPRVQFAEYALSPLPSPFHDPCPAVLRRWHPLDCLGCAHVIVQV